MPSARLHVMGVLRERGQLSLGGAREGVHEGGRELGQLSLGGARREVSTTRVIQVDNPVLYTHTVHVIHGAYVIRISPSFYWSYYTIV